MSSQPEKKRESWLPRLSRTSVFNPTIVSAAQNPGARRNSDATNVSPMTSQAGLSTADAAMDTTGDETSVPSPQPLSTPDEHDEAFSPFQEDEFEKRESRNDSTSTSATGPAGSGMPPAETAFTSEKEVVEVEEPDASDATPRPPTRNTLLAVPPADSPRTVQSPRPDSAFSQLGSLDASSMAVDDVNSTAAQLARLGSSFRRSRSSIDVDNPQPDATDDASIMLQTAQTARMKRPSLVNYPGTGSSGAQVSDLSTFIMGGDVPLSARNLMPRSKSVATGSLVRERARWSNSPSAIRYGAAGTSREQNVDVLGPLLAPPNSAVTSDDHLPRKVDTLTLQDALATSPPGSGNIPKRSITVPSSLGARRKAKYPSLVVSSQTPSIREDVVTTPYPKTKEEINLIKDEIEETGGVERDEGKAEDVAESQAYKFDLTITVRNRSSTIAVSRFEDHHAKSKFWWKSKKNDDERIIRMAHTEYTHLVGNVRSFLGAKTAKAVRLRFVRPDKPDHLLEPDTPLIGGRFGSIAETDLWRLWSNPVQGHNKREWLNILTHNSQIFGKSRAFVLEVTEGYDATRVITAFAIVTALSLIAMFFWLFLGVGGEGSSVTIVDGTALQPASSLTTVTLRAGDAFIFGIWILFLGWTGVAGWMFAS